jgi:hypothetical protein
LPAVRASSGRVTAAIFCCLGAGCLDMDGEVEVHEQATTSCPLDLPGVYSPYADDGDYPAGTVGDLPWRGASSAYPDGLEDFRGYASYPTTVECSTDKGRRSHLDVTAGCLEAVTLSDGRYTRGRVHTTADGYFRALARARADGETLPVKWTDQAIEYRFFHRGRTGSEGYPGFKVFARYRSEDDLYVASWRFDGVVQIQRKLCGDYTVLARREMSPPSAEVWHRIRFEALGDQLTLTLDGAAVLRASSHTFSWGTGGIRIDSVDGAYLDDWRVSDPGS